MKIEWQETAFAQMISSLQTQRVDIALAGMSDLPSRREVVDFIDYMKTGPQFFTTANRAGELKTIEDLCGKKIAVEAGTTMLDYAADAREFNEQLRLLAHDRERAVQD